MSKLWKPWSKRDDAMLTKLWHAEKSAAYIAAVLLRTEAAVAERARQIGMPRRSGALRNSLAAEKRRANRSGRTPPAPEPPSEDPIIEAGRRHARACFAAGGFPYVDFARKTWVWPNLKGLSERVAAE